MNNDILNNLNNQQIKAVEHVNGPSIILAGAGSGKTRVLTSKVLYLIKNQKVDPSSIVMVTFTNKAAGEMKRRVGHHLGFIGTFHSFCLMLLKRFGHYLGYDHNFIIYDDDDKTSLLKKICQETKLGIKITPSTAEYKISSAKNNLVDPSTYNQMATSEYEQAIAKIYFLYQQTLKKNNAMDFDDLIFNAVTLLKNYPDALSYFQDRFKYFLVDEFQDTNAAQYELAKLLASKNKNITVVGDFCQSIYSWRGAEIANLFKFETDFSGSRKFHLEQNYRSTQNILNFAYDIISANQTHPILNLFTNNNGGDEVDKMQLNNEQEEAIFIASRVGRENGQVDLNNFAVLYRINAQSRVIEEALLHYGIPYILIGGVRFYERAEIKDILSYLRLVINPVEEVSLKRANNIGKKRYQKFQELYSTIKDYRQFTTDELLRKIINTTGYLSLYNQDDADDQARIENIKELRSVAKQFPDLSQFLDAVALVESEYFESEKNAKNKNGIKLMTLHQAKGLEFDTVFIVGVEEGLLPHSRSIYDQHELEEERRLFYVGITRARKKLYITYTKKRFLFGRRIPAMPSRFLGIGDDEYIPKTF